MSQRITLSLLLVSLLMCSTIYAQGARGETEKKQPKEDTKPRPRPAAPRKEVAPTPKSSPKPLFADLTVKTNQAGCSVSLNGQPKGLTNESGFLSILQLKPGRFIITVTKSGYGSQEGTIDLSPGEAEAFTITLKPLPGKLSIKPNIPGAKIEIDGIGTYNETVSELSLPAGRYRVEVTKSGYKPTIRDIEIKPAEPLSLDIAVEPISVEELLEQAESDFLEKHYKKVIETCKKILTTEPDQPRANLLLGKCYYNSEDYLSSAPFLAKAISMGQAFTLTVSHRHRGGRGFDFSKVFDEDLCKGEIILTKDSFEFKSTSTTMRGKAAPKHDFIVPYKKISGLNPTFAKEQLEIKVNLLDGGKEKAKPYDFFPEDAALYTNERNNAEIYCNNCKHTTQVLFKLLQQLK